jgi:PAS domain-containing protein
VCPSHAKKIRSDLQKVRQLMTEKKPVYCSLAPSAASEFGPHYRQLLTALTVLGFEGISETAIGAQLVNEAIEMYAKQHQGECPWISTACPTVVEAVKTYYPALIDQLSPVPSPLQCHSAYLRHLYGQHIGIVFIGPCIAKKLEADHNPGYPDFALSFEELRLWLELEGITFEQLEEAEERYVPAKAGSATLYPVEGGMIGSLSWGNDPFQTKALALSGFAQVLDTLQSPEQNHQFLELLFCEGGCINGPVATKLSSAAQKKGAATRFTRSRLEQKQALFSSDPQFAQLLLTEGYALLGKSQETAKRQKPKSFTDEAILRAMKLLGKHSSADELNCGGCGYNDCRHMAAAYLEGMAEAEMCVTMMRKQAQSKIDVLLQTIPIGVVIVDDQLTIVDCNSFFLEQFANVEFAIDNQSLNLVAGLPLQRFVPFYQKFRSHFDNPKPCTYRIHCKDSYLKVTFFAIEKQHLVGALFEDITTATVRRDTVVKKAENVIQRSLETVQQIASLLGENAADTEITLNSLIEAFTTPTEEAGESV